MDALEENQNSIQSQTRQTSVTFNFIIKLVILLAGYQILTEEELEEAGIKLDGHRND